MKISKKTREQAALICALCASADQRADEWESTYQASVLADLDRPAQMLASTAWATVCNVASHTADYDARTRERYAEAEALLRTGWSP